MTDALALPPGLPLPSGVTAHPCPSEAGQRWYLLHDPTRGWALLHVCRQFGGTVVASYTRDRRATRFTDSPNRARWHTHLQGLAADLPHIEDEVLTAAVLDRLHDEDPDAAHTEEALLALANPQHVEDLAYYRRRRARPRASI